jgi:hypothetical protein
MSGRRAPIKGYLSMGASPPALRAKTNIAQDTTQRPSPLVNERRFRAGAVDLSKLPLEQFPNATIAAMGQAQT